LKIFPAPSPPFVPSHTTTLGSLSLPSRMCSHLLSSVFFLNSSSDGGTPLVFFPPIPAAVYFPPSASPLSFFFLTSVPGNSFAALFLYACLHHPILISLQKDTPLQRYPPCSDPTIFGAMSYCSQLATLSPAAFFLFHRPVFCGPPSIPQFPPPGPIPKLECMAVVPFLFPFPLC